MYLLFLWTWIKERGGEELDGKRLDCTKFSDMGDGGEVQRGGFVKSAKWGEAMRQK